MNLNYAEHLDVLYYFSPITNVVRGGGGTCFQRWIYETHSRTLKIDPKQAFSLAQKNKQTKHPNSNF